MGIIPGKSFEVFIMKKLGKRIVAVALAMCAAFSSATAFAEHADEIDTEYITGISFEEYAGWGINDYAENIKSIYKFDYPKQADIIDKIVDTISVSKEFAAIFEEEGGAAFKIIEDSLRDTLEPSISLCDYTDELYFSKYWQLCAS